MRPKIWSRSRFAAVLAAFGASTAIGATTDLARAGSLEVSDGVHDVVDGIIRVAGDCCVGAACTARFQLDNAGTGTVTAIKLSAGTLTDGAGHSIGAAAVAFTPPGLPKLGPTGVQVFSLAIEHPAAAIGGLYRGLVIIRADGVVDLEVPLEVTLCAPPAPSVRLVSGLGQLVGDRLAFVPDGGDCGAGVYVAEFVAEANGDVPLTQLVASVSGLPGGAELLIEPTSLALAAGEQGTFRATVRTSGVAPGGYTGSLLVVDPSGAAATATAALDVCRGPQPGIAIVEEGGLRFAATSGGCASGKYRLEVTVANVGDVELGAVAVSLDGLGAAAEVVVAPTQLPLAVGERATVQIEVTGLILTGVQRATVTARDAALGVAVERVAILEGCPTDEPPVLALTHTATRSSVQLGGVLTLSVAVTNRGGQFARDLAIDDLLPTGWEQVSGRSAVDGTAWDDPKRSRSGRHRWTIRSLAPGATATLRFQVVVTPAARLGRAFARATAHAGDASAGPVDLAFDVTRQHLRPFGTVRGTVRFEVGGAVVGARVLLDSDLDVETGADGRFQFDALLGGEHLVSLDGRSLAPGESLQGDDSILVRLFSGATEEVEFVVAARPRLGLRLQRLEPSVEE